MAGVTDTDDLCAKLRREVDYSDSSGLAYGRMLREAGRMLREAADKLRALEAERDRLRAENEALRKDAERYRWLREEVGGTHIPLAQVVWKLNNVRECADWTNMADGHSLDESIDAELAKERQP